MKVFRLMNAGESIATATSLLMYATALTITAAGAAYGATDNADTSRSASGGISAGSLSHKPVRDKWALIVGIGEFGNNKIPRLKYAAKDARDFYNYLTKEAHFAPDHVRILLDEKATQRRIMSELGSKFLARMARPDDMIVLFFSTHGSPSQMDLRGKNYIVANDSDPEDLFATGIEMQKVLESIQSRVLSDRVLLVLDACHSGSASTEGKGLMRSGNFDAASLAEGSGQMVICSSKPDEQSWESKRYENGVFTKNLLDNLRADNSNVALTAAFERASQAIQNEVREDHPGARQTPVMQSKWSGSDLRLAVKPAAPENLPPTVMRELELDSTEALYSRPAVKASVADAAASAVSSNVASSAASNMASNVASSAVSNVASNKSSAPPSQTVAAVGSRSNTGSYAPQYIEEGAAQDGSALKLVLTRSYFSNDPNPQKAYQSACEASQANFNNSDLYYRKARLLIQMGKFGKAMQELTGVLVDDPNNEHYRLARAYCYAKQGMKGLAEDDIRTAQFKNPKLPNKIEIGD